MRRFIAFAAPLLIAASLRAADAPRVSLYSTAGLLLAEEGNEYVWLGNRPVAQFDDGAHAVRWTFADALEAPLVQADAGGQITWRAEFEPFGGVHAFRSGAALHQPLRFLGQEAEEDMGDRVYNNQRWYRPGWGRYTQSDPLAFQRPKSWGATDGYLYVDGQPTRFTDPSGLIRWDSSCDTCGNPQSYDFTNTGIDPGYRKQVDRETSIACSRVTTLITDRWLASCIQKRCEETTISCGGCTPAPETSRPMARAFPAVGGTAATSVVLCINFVNGVVGKGYAGVAMIHELAHNCGWDHFLGSGVPNLYNPSPGYPAEATNWGPW
jgi:RHS repeat-associated protein